MTPLTTMLLSRTTLGAPTVMPYDFQFRGYVRHDLSGVAVLVLAPDLVDQPKEALLRNPLVSLVLLRIDHHRKSTPLSLHDHRLAAVINHAEQIGEIVSSFPGAHSSG